MPQPKSSSGRSSSKRSSSGGGSTKSRSGGGRSSTASAGDDARLAQVRELLGQAVVIPAERLQAVLDDARSRGHLDAKGVEDIAHGLLKQAEDVRRELEALLGRGVANVEEVVTRATEGARAAGRRAAEAGEPLLRAVGRGERTQTGTAKDKAKGGGSAKAKGGSAKAKGDGSAKAKGGSAKASKAASSGAKATSGSAKASKAASSGGKGRASSGGTKRASSGGTKSASSGGGASRGFPIEGYDDMKAAEVVAKLDALTAAQLRKVRKQEEQGSSRKTVLQAIDRKLG